MDDWKSKDHSFAVFSRWAGNAVQKENSPAALYGGQQRDTHFPSWAGLRKLPRGVPRKGRPRRLPALPCGTGAVTPREPAMTGGSSSRRRRAEERSSAAGTERSSRREAARSTGAGGMGAGPALAALLLAGSVLSATLLAPGRQAEPGERPHGLGALGTVRGPVPDLPTARGAQDSSVAPGPRWGGQQCRRRGAATRIWLSRFSCRALGWVLGPSPNSLGEMVKK